MKKIIIAIAILSIFVACFCINIYAADASASRSFSLSETNLTASGLNYNYTSGDATVKTYVQHWKGNAAHADTARTQIVSHNNLSSKRCEVYIYVNGNLNTSNINSDVAETATGLWKTVQRTYHKITTTSNNGQTYLYEANGVQ